MGETTLRVATVAHGLAPGVLGATGPGGQLVLQGCGIGCPGCTSQHTHSPTGGRVMPVTALVRLMRRLHGHGQLRRLTVTGGEPTEQAPALQAFLALFTRAMPACEVVLYSGRPWLPCSATVRGCWPCATWWWPAPTWRTARPQRWPAVTTRRCTC